LQSVKNIERREQNTGPVIINETLDILSYRCKNPADISNFIEYKELLEEDALNIYFLYSKNSQDLIFNGYVNEATFYTAFKACFSNDTNKIRISNAKEDKSGIDFKLQEARKSPTNFDVTISRDSYALRLSQHKGNILLLPIIDPKNKTFFVKLLLENPSEENFRHYLTYLADYNEKILNNEMGRKFNIIVSKENKNFHPKTITYYDNGQRVYEIHIGKSKYKKSMRIIKMLKNFNL
jgi:hypothetical protein